jgi:hypothetical protein
MKFGAMDPNMKLVLEEMAKLCIEMECFAVQEASFSKRLDAVAVDEQFWDTRVINLEEATTAFDKAFTKWRPGVDSSITTI